MRVEPAGRWRVALAGLIGLSVAMGIGRFAFTPLLPLMLADGVIDLPGASWLASVNYIGYLLGALLCTFQPWIWSRVPGLPAVHAAHWVRGGLLATAVLTLGMGLHVPFAWPLLRFAAGLASAMVFVYGSGWCAARLARLGAPQLGGVMFAGPGVGIMVSGLLATGMVAWHWTAASGWFIFSGAAFLLVAAVWRVFEPDDVMAAASTGPSGQPKATSALKAEIAALTVAYGLAGFGYIVTATFLPVIARASMPGSIWLDLFWPIFGLGVVVGALLATRLPMTGDIRWLLFGAYVLQAAGILSSVVWPSAAGFAIGSLMLGVPFTAITFFALQEVRRLRPLQAPSFMGLLTVLYGLGQIVGPPMVAALLHRSATPAAGFAMSLEVAAAALVAGAAIYLWMIRAFPLVRTGRSSPNP
ncbi:MAG: YbfB/YjiJ family transporter [Rhizobacter sp.]|nr:YbfB/YjiJ family transporter [Rhizobacter sp.]